MPGRYVDKSPQVALRVMMKCGVGERYDLVLDELLHFQPMARLQDWSYVVGAKSVSDTVSQGVLDSLQSLKL